MNAPASNSVVINNILDIYHQDARGIDDIDLQRPINLTLTSPPYFDLKDYGAENQIGLGQTYQNYLTDLTGVFEEVYKKTADDGSLWIVIDTFRRDGELVTLPFDLKDRLRSVGWQLNDIIIWKKDRTLPWLHSGITRNIFEYILVFSKFGHKMKYYPDRVREHTDLKKWWVRYPERYNPKGKALEGVWNIDIPTQGSWGKSTPRHFCPFPAALVKRIVRLATDSGDLVFDPFAGTGSVLSEAFQLKRDAVGTELNKELVDSFQERIASIMRLSELDVKETDEIDFENKIINLRALKFAKLILKRIKLEFGCKNSWIYADVSSNYLLADHHIFSAKYMVFVPSTAANKEAVFNLLNGISKKPPFSKFGISPYFEVYDKEEAILADIELVDFYFTYTLTNTHKYGEKIKRADLVSKKKIIISPIHVSVEEPDE